MIDRDRDERLIAIVRAHGTTTVTELSRELGIGPSTIRRDLRRLARDGRLVRTYGGATLAGRSDGRARAPADPRPRREAARGRRRRRTGPGRADDRRDERQHGRRVRPPAGRPGDLTVITNSLDVAQVLLDCEGIQLVVLGGVVRPRMHSLLGHLTEQACREMRADTLFMGIGAISLERGLMNDYMPEILTDRALRSMATSVVVIADSGKFDLVAPALVFGLDERRRHRHRQRRAAGGRREPHRARHPGHRRLRATGGTVPIEGTVPERDPRGTRRDPGDRGRDRGERPGRRGRRCAPGASGASG